MALVHAQECPSVPEIYSDNDMPSVSDIFKTIIVTALGYVPDAGAILSACAGLFWPDSAINVWDDIKSKVEKLVDQKLDRLVYKQLYDELNSLGSQISLYVLAIKNGDQENIRGYFRSMNLICTGSAIKFQNEDFEWLLAPLFAIFVQMHLTLLREGVLYGRQWGWSDAVYNENLSQLRKSKISYARYLSDCVEHQRKRLQACEPATSGQHKTAIYDYWQPFEAFQIPMIDDYIRLIDYYRDTPDGMDIKDIQFADVYSPTFGTADDFDAVSRRWGASVVPAFHVPLSAIDTIDIELFNNSPRVVNVHYPSGTGPMVLSQQNRRTDQVGIIGQQRPGVEQYTIELPPPLPGCRFNIASAIVRVGSIPLTVTLVACDGNQYQLWDRKDLRGTEYTVAVPGRKLTTLNMWTYSRFYDYTLGCILFGFSRDPGDVSEEVKKILYITAVTQPESGDPQLPDKIGPQLLEARYQHWSHIAQKARRVTGH